MAVIPVAKALYLCEEVDVEGGQVNLYALFNTIRASTFPHKPEPFCVFAQLGGGLGEVPVHFDIVRARDESVIYVSEVNRQQFARRSQVIQLSMKFEAVVFREPGVYLVQLFCDNSWVADVVLDLRERH
jgi:hypothetical protein